MAVYDMPAGTDLEDSRGCHRSALLFNNCHLYTDNLHPYTQPHFRRLLVYVPDTKASAPEPLFRLLV